MSAVNSEIEYTDFYKVNKNNFQKIKNKATKIGYADGLNDGRESVFQNGFDKGYKDGLRTSFDLEKFRFFFTHLNADKIKNQDLLREKEEYEKLTIGDSKSQFEFICLQHRNGSLSPVLRKQHVNLEEIFPQKLPKATSLLRVQPSTHLM